LNKIIAQESKKMIEQAGEKIAVAVGSGTALTGVVTYVDILPAVMGVIASCVGVVVSITVASVVVYCRLKKGKIERELLHLQVDEFKIRNDSRRERQEKGDPLRRKNDKHI
jgi:hypothetical protein